MSNVELIWLTPNAEQIIAYCARVSNPANQNSKDIKKLLAYCIEHGHWSIYEMANMTVQIETTRAISAQIIRHRSFSFQEFSQRYAVVPSIMYQEARLQDKKNRQNSIETDDLGMKAEFFRMQDKVYDVVLENYNKALKMGIAKECARMMLPMSTGTKLYMNGNLRSWMHYFQLRCDDSTQKEHRDIANQIKAIFKQELPILGELL